MNCIALIDIKLSTDNPVFTINTNNNIAAGRIGETG